MFGKHHAIRIVKNLTGNRMIQQEPKVVISINPGKEMPYIIIKNHAEDHRCKAVDESVKSR